MLSVLFGIGGFAFSFWFVLSFHGDKFSGFFERTAFVLLTVAPISVIFVSHSFMDFFSGIKTLFTTGFVNTMKEMNTIANQLSTLSSSVRSEGIGVIAKQKDRVQNPFFREGLTLILSSFTTEEIKHNMIAKINTKQAEFQHAANLFESLGRLCPGMGLVGTIIGLVQMLSNLSDPTKLGAGMAVSLLATLYGLILGTVIYTPMAEKIKICAEKSLQLDTMIMEGVLLLKEKKSNAHVRDVLSTYSHSKPPMNANAAPSMIQSQEQTQISGKR
jgi:chemotaxis protein MotA